MPRAPSDACFLSHRSLEFTTPGKKDCLSVQSLDTDTGDQFNDNVHVWLKWFLKDKRASLWGSGTVALFPTGISYDQEKLVSSEEDALCEVRERCMAELRCINRKAGLSRPKDGLPHSFHWWFKGNRRLDLNVWELLQFCQQGLWLVWG